MTTGLVIVAVMLVLAWCEAVVAQRRA